MSSVYSQSLSVSENDEFGWNTIQDRLRDSVVAIKSNTAFYFDTEVPGHSNATGFVVDSEHGLIVSSRHVMETGPVSHKAVFANDIEVPLQPFFYDPVHDFSIFRYNPAELKSFKPTEIPLCPEEAYSGMEFRIVSNDSCEKLSVHGGELSQLNRNPPEYQSGYADYNCFYIQASTSASSGSSGSPVVNIDGKAVAMVAGGKSNSSSSYFVTLHRLVYALEYVRQGEVPPRGTLQAIFVHVTNSEAQRLGLTEELAIEQGIEMEELEGFLKVDSILTSGPADGKLKIGDIILSINEYPINGFLELSEIVDASVSNDVTINIFRDDQFLNVIVSVQDMYSLIPTQLLRVGGAYIHDMSFHLAAETSTPISGVYITYAHNNFFPESLIGDNRILCSVNDIPTPNIEALMDVFNSVARGEYIKCELYSISRHQDIFRQVLSCPLLSLPNILYTRSQATGFWSATPYTGLPQVKSIEKLFSDNDNSKQAKTKNTTAFKKQWSFIQSKISNVTNVIMCNPQPDFNRGIKTVIGQKGVKDYLPKSVKKIGQSMVTILVESFVHADGSKLLRQRGCGFIASIEKGIVICSASVVENQASHISINIQDNLRMPATLVYIHPLYPIAFLKCDPSQLQGVNGIGVSDLNLKKIDNAEKLSEGAQVLILSQGNYGDFEVYTSSIICRSTGCSNDCSCCTNPKYYNFEQYSLDNMPDVYPDNINVVCNIKGKICGLLLEIPSCNNTTVSHLAGIDISVLSRPLKTLLSKTPDSFDSYAVLDAEYSTMSLLKAKTYGLSKQHINEIVNNAPFDHHKVITVEKILSKRDSGIQSLQAGDIILKCNGTRVYRIAQLSCFYDQSYVDLDIIRDQEEMTIRIPTTVLPRTRSSRIVCWAGIVMQEPWEQVKKGSVTVPSQIFAYNEIEGSPAVPETAYIKYYVTEINKTPVNTLDDVVRVVKQLKSPGLSGFNQAVANNQCLASGAMPGCDVKVRTVAFNGSESLATIRTNDQYFPAWQAIRGPSLDNTWKIEFL